jgi:RNase P/RNase MRP subunit p29
MRMIVGERVKVLNASDHTQVGVSGEVVLESANTIVIEDEGKMRRVPKNGTLLQLEGRREIVRGDELSGRLEDRLQRLTR